MIDKRPDLINELSNEGYIPRDMFVAYSTQALIDLESPNGIAPPATTYHDTGNRLRRLEALLAPDGKIMLPGGVGTDEELLHTVRQHIDEVALSRSAANDNPVAESERVSSRLVIYNRDGQWNRLLQQMQLVREDGQVNDVLAQRYNIAIVDQAEALKPEIEQEKERQVSLRGLSDGEVQGRVAEAPTRSHGMTG
jgi:predicted Rossmann-fold nucleotide-binding protein